MGAPPFTCAAVVTLLLAGEIILKRGTCDDENGRRFLLGRDHDANLSDFVKHMAELTNAFVPLRLASFRGRKRKRANPNCEVASTPIGRLAPRPVGNCAACCNKNLDDAVELYLVGDRGCYRPLRIYKDKKSKNKWNPENDVVLYLHGFGQGRAYQPGMGLCEAYARRSDKFNILIGDHGRMLPFPWYVNAVENVPFIGHTLADRLIYYDSVGFIKIEKLHIIGHSLGAQIAAVVGHTIKQKLNKKISRITGLDAAYPLINGPDSTKLTPDDAEYVDAVHTNAGIFGFPSPIGDADFYMNGGHRQPDCKISLNVCSHLMAVLYFAETVDDPLTYSASNNGTTYYMGFLAKESNAQGSIHIKTKRKRRLL